MAFSNGDILVYNGTQWVNQKSLVGPFDIASPTFHVDNTNHRVGIGTTSPNSRLHVAGSVATAVTSVTADYTLSPSDSLVRADSTSGAIALTLPSAVGITGRQSILKHW